MDEQMKQRLAIVEVGTSGRCGRDAGDWERFRTGWHATLDVGDLVQGPGTS